jgi:hypothetical protein
MRAVLVALVVGASPALAEPTDITWTFPAWPVGSSFLMSVDGKSPDKNVTAGKDALGYRVDVYDPEGHMVYTYWSDETGATTASRSGDTGKPDRFIPNDCTTTLGRCEYTEILAGQGPRKVVRETTATADGVDFTVAYADGTSGYSGHWALDGEGFLISGWMEYEDGKRMPSLMIGEPIRAAE